MRLRLLLGALGVGVMLIAWITLATLVVVALVTTTARLLAR